MRVGVPMAIQSVHTDLIFLVIATMPDPCLTSSRCVPALDKITGRQIGVIDGRVTIMSVH